MNAFPIELILSEIKIKKKKMKSEHNKTVCPLVAYIHSDDTDLRNRITFRFKMDGIGTNWQVTGKGLENFQCI